LVVLLTNQGSTTISNSNNTNLNNSTTNNDNSTTNNDNSTTNNNINNSTTNNITNINIVDFRKEDLSCLQRNDIGHIFLKGNNAVLEMITRLNFNPKLPQNHNVFKSNLQDKYIYIFRNNKWVVVEQDEVIEDLITKRTDELKKIHSEFEYRTELGRRAKEKFENTGMTLCDRPQEIEVMKKDIKILMYNERDIVIKTKKAFERQQRALKDKK
jgi:hypothetical protein